MQKEMEAETYVPTIMISNLFILMEISIKFIGYTFRKLYTSNKFANNYVVPVKMS